ncbi:MAG: glycosyltransferase family 39 protein [Planctomycetia bacterium]|nr:glycosyltransferase family 39 protein [Planctomycetia bacterium]
MTEAPEPAAATAPRTAPTLAAIVALAFAARLGFALLKATVATDAYWYVRIANFFLAGDWAAAVNHGYHPAYPALAALFSLVLRDVPLAATAVSVLLGALTSLPAWSIGARLGGPRAALFAALLVAVHPECVDEGSDILVEATFVFFFLSGVACALRAVATLDLPAAALSGLCAGLAYLTRPEGLVLPAFTAVALAAAALPRLRGAAPAQWGRRAAAAALAAGVFLACALPYLVHLRHTQGRWTVTGKAGGEAFSGGPQAAKGESQAAVETKGQANPAYLPWYFARKFLETVYLGFLPLLVAAFFVAAPRDSGARLARLALLGLLALYLPPLVRLLYAKSYVSTRHLLAPSLLVVLLLAPVAAALSERWKRGLPALVLLVAVVALPKSLRPARRDQLPLKQAGLWLRETAPGAELMGPEKAAFYAQVYFHKVPKSRAGDDIADRMRASNVEWLVLLESDQPGVAAKLDGRFGLVKDFGSGEDRVAVYRLAR